MAESALTLPKKGSEEEWIMEPRHVSNSQQIMIQYKFRYGSSMKIIAQGENLIADEFTSSNPNKDWKKYQKSGKELFYCLIEDMSSDAVVCVARSILDFPSVENSKNSKVKRNICDQKRMILDYIHTSEASRGQGLAADLIKFLQRISKAEGSDFYVLSIEESQGYFLTKFDMILEQDENLTQHYNCFSDTFLLKSPDNTTGCKDTKLHKSFIDNAIEEQEDNVDNQEEIEVSDDESSDADSDLENAIQESLQSASGTVVVHNENEDLSEEQQVEIALALSLSSQSQTQQTTSNSSNPDKPGAGSSEIHQNHVQNSAGSDNSLSALTDEEMLNQAIALSLSNSMSDDKEKT